MVRTFFTDRCLAQVIKTLDCFIVITSDLQLREDKNLVGAGEDRARYAYLDLLAGTLTEHEKNLDRLISRLEEISGSLSELRKREKPAKLVQRETSAPAEAPETLVYMKLKIDRPAEELKKILDSLKE